MHRPLALSPRDSSDAVRPLALAWRVLWALLLLLRVPAFLLLYWLRLPVLFLCELVSLLMLLAWLFSWYAFPERPQMVWGFAAISFLGFAMAWLYDGLLVALAPPTVLRTL